MNNWTLVIQEQLAVVRSAQLTTTDWARGAGATSEQAEMLLEPYREILEVLYARELPFAELADSLPAT